MIVFITTKIERAASAASVFLRTQYGLWLLAVVSFMESAFPIPIVTDPFVVAYILVNRTLWVRAVMVTTITSVLGGIVAYLLAAGFYEVIQQTGFAPDLEVEFQSITTMLQDGVFWITLAGAFTPIPYTVVGLAAGFVKANFFLFILASLIGRGVRYLIVGWLTYRFGEQALEIARRRILLISAIGLILGLTYLALH